MKVDISEITRFQAEQFICASSTLSPIEEMTMSTCLLMSNDIWIGCVDGELACVWGLIPPTLLSTQAYLWLYHTDLVSQHQFLFVRNSQRVVESMLQKYDTIVGYVMPNNVRGQRWLKWLGAEFVNSDEKRIQFRIRKHG